MKRFKLEKFIAGPGAKEFYGKINSTAGELIQEEVFVAGQDGNIVEDLAETYFDSTVYSIEHFRRDYSVNNPSIYSNGYDLNVRATSAGIHDMIQLGDYAFHLTYQTPSGTMYQINPSGDIWYIEPHQVVTYEPTSIGIENSTIQDIIGECNISFNETVYGMLSGDAIILFVKGMTGDDASTVYSNESEVSNSLPFAYLLEHPLANGIDFAPAPSAYGFVSGGSIYIAFSPSLGDSVYSPDPEIDDINKFLVNPFCLKNQYNQNYNTDLDLVNLKLKGIRDYLRVGKSQEDLWLSYNYYVDNSNILQEYEFVERVYGLYKLKGPDGHKSNIYSIRIRNSGLNKSIANESFRAELQGIIQNIVLDMVKKIAPSSTQLWKVEFEGR